MMNINIETKNDFTNGTTYVVSVPESEVDRSALLTMEADSPDFALPFKRRIIDGMVELTYMVGNRSKLAYMSKDKFSEREYAEFLKSVLMPLLNCDDYFMKPSGFVIDYDYIYYDVKTNKTCYLYIPVRSMVSDQDSLKNLVGAIIGRHRVNSLTFENKCLHALRNFQLMNFIEILNTVDVRQREESTAAPKQSPEDFMKRLNSHYNQETPQSESHRSGAHVPKQKASEMAEPMKRESASAKRSGAEEKSDSYSTSSGVSLADDIVIQFPSGGKKKDKKDNKKEENSDGKKSGLFGFHFGKKEKDAPKASEKQSGEKEKRGLFSGKDKNKGKKAESPSKGISSGAVNDYSDMMRNHQNPPAANPPQYIREYDDKTEIAVEEKSGPRLRYIGNQDHPREIYLEIQAGESFRIGRVDVSANGKQSDFEFNQKTKGVSRRHAMILRKPQGYYLVDLGSSAGTMIEGNKLPPNAEFPISSGTRISFGNLGADYIFEE